MNTDTQRHRSTARHKCGCGLSTYASSCECMQACRVDEISHAYTLSSAAYCCVPSSLDCGLIKTAIIASSTFHPRTPPSRDPQEATSPTQVGDPSTLPSPSLTPTFHHYDCIALARCLKRRRALARPSPMLGLAPIQYLRNRRRQQRRPLIRYRLIPPNGANQRFLRTEQ